MAYPFKRILSPVDFDNNSLSALEVAEKIARENDGTILLLHVVPLIVPPAGMPGYVEIYKGQEDVAREKLREIAARRLRGIKYELFIHVGEPAGSILGTAKRAGADVIVMATHGRRGFSRFMLGSVAEVVLREAACPVLCIRHGDADKSLVSRWMSSSPVTAIPDEELSKVQTRMREGNFRCAPVLDDGRLVGIITDRDVRSHIGSISAVKARYAMTEAPVTVEPTTPIHDAARILLERKIDALPVIEEGHLVGVMTTSDVIRAFLEQN